MKIYKTEVKHGENLLTWLRKKGYSLPSPCGGKGVCGKCRVRVLEGENGRNHNRSHNVN
jgi:ferredoxin